MAAISFLCFYIIQYENVFLYSFHFPYFISKVLMFDSIPYTYFGWQKEKID